MFSRDAREATFTADQLLRITNSTSLQANELQLVLANVSRGSLIASQGLREMLPALGLVRNTGLSASRVGSSVSRALLSMSKNAERFKNELGVDVIDPATGEFRDFLDVIWETGGAIEAIPDAARRANIARELFDSFGLPAFTGIMTQLRQGIRNTEGELIRGAEAIEFLRGSMDGAAGTVQQFTDILLRDLQGQLKLLEGAVQTFTVLVGEPFARVFRPFVRMLLQMTSAVDRFINVLPEQVTTFAAAAVVAFGAFTTLAGGLALVITGIIVMIPIMKTLFAVFALVSVIMAPIILLTGLLTAAVAGFVFFVRQNVGGVGDFFSNVFDRVALAYNSIVELLQTGRISGALAEDLSRDTGLLRFVNVISRIAARVQSFIRGLQQGFIAGVGTIQPIVRSISFAFSDLGRALGLVGGDIEDLTGKISVLGASERGAQIGVLLGRGMGFVAQGIRRVIVLFSSFIQASRRLFFTLLPNINEATRVFGGLRQEITRTFGGAVEISQNADDSIRGFGEFLGTAFVGSVRLALRVLIGVARIVLRIVSAFQWWNEQMRRSEAIGEAISLSVQTAFETMKDGILTAIDLIIVSLGWLASAIPERFRPSFLSRVIVAGEAAETRIDRRLVAASQRGEELGVAFEATRARQITANQFIEDRTARIQETNVGQKVIDLKNSIERLGNRPIQVNVTLDGEQIANSVETTNRENMDSAFQPVGVPA